MTGPARRQAATIRVETGIEGLPGNEGHFSSATERIGKFDPSAFRDRYRDALRQLIEAKMKGFPVRQRAVSARRLSPI